MYLILFILMFILAVVFTVLSLSRRVERYITDLLYPALALVLWSILAAAGVVSYEYSWPVIANVTNSSGTLIYSYSLMHYNYETPIYPLNYFFLGMMFIMLIIVIYRIFISYTGG